MKVRVRFSKLGKIRFISHRDVARIWDRAVRRARLPVAYSEGFNPRTRLSFGLALSTGHESVAEYLDIELIDGAEPPDPADLPQRLTAVLPHGLAATAALLVERRQPSLQHAVTQCTWRIDVADVSVDSAAGAVARALAADHLIVTRERKGKRVTDDLRPSVLGLDVEGPTRNGARLIAELGTQPRAVRPSELLVALDPPLVESRVRRLNQWITTEDGERREPVLLPTPEVAPVGAR